ncbi:hypothetical protein AVEN_188202-1 [Araneus ventricosus]|uniref:Endonuclease/exonuclease/phosphatase domain-containing protein n=1 Tax=Araneus ventricosus TaxID=182803 RepID=A0A4Y2KCP5_ARAVE|nr:hypothetical protein AVEN_188202-1 [Araneus ventricosus]
MFSIEDCIIQLASTPGSRSSALSTTNCEEKKGEGGRVHFTNPYVNKTSVYKGSKILRAARSQRVKADDNLSHPNKIFFRTHRSNRLGSGLLIGIPKNMSGRVIYSIENDPNLEVLAVEIQSKNLNFIIINIYAPHGFSIASIKRFLDSLSVPTFIFGDFNLHHPLWGGSSQSSLSESFVDWLNNSDFSMLDTSAPTRISNPHTSSIIDLTLCSASIYNEIDYVFDCTFESDHIPIVVSWSKFQNTTRSIKTIIWNPIITKSIEIFNTTSQPNIDLITDQISRTISAHTSNKILVDKDYPP